ncbi:alpha/beta hydrolase [Taibaiella soli]|uniref:Alpha/beta hydrolase n=1 Tax=Taibaiella soli TaxID=1649169 RepID=A0A2W2ALV4_9BACT|nr:alpha/beta fold hydrolase [Taibaiella soli]PZF74512.1 alpha/beta hydrolase [Taibaiella soli]
MPRFFKRSLVVVTVLFVIMNIVAAFHAYKFTHFATDIRKKTTKEEAISFSEKCKILFFGIDLPRPVNKVQPSVPFKTITLQSNKKLECWWLPTANAKGTVIVFHGYGSSKAGMLDKAYLFQQMDYNVLLPDFMGSGGSEGNQTTIGYKEAENVKTCYDYIHEKGEQNIVLFGTSMGAASILKSLHDCPLAPTRIIIECPFGSTYQTVKARFKMLHVPAFPMAGLLTFWGGMENGFNAFAHNPTTYAKSVHCPTLLLYGEKDEKVSRAEIDEIYQNLQGTKQLQTFPAAGHDNYLIQYKDLWYQTIKSLL